MKHTVSNWMGKIQNMDTAPGFEIKDVSVKKIKNALSPLFEATAIVVRLDSETVYVSFSDCAPVAALKGLHPMVRDVADPDHDSRYWSIGVVYNDNTKGYWSQIDNRFISDVQWSRRSWYPNDIYLSSTPEMNVSFSLVLASYSRKPEYHWLREGDSIPNHSSWRIEAKEKEAQYAKSRYHAVSQPYAKRWLSVVEWVITCSQQWDGPLPDIWYWSTSHGWTRDVSQATRFTQEERDKYLATNVSPIGPDWTGVRVWSKLP